MARHGSSPWLVESIPPDRGHRGVVPPSLTLTSFTQVMGKNKVLVKVNPEGKYVVSSAGDFNSDVLCRGSWQPCCGRGC